MYAHHTDPQGFCLWPLHCEVCKGVIPEGFPEDRLLRMANIPLDDDYSPLPVPAVTHYTDQWASGYRDAMQDVANYLRTDGKAQIVQWVEGMLHALPGKP